jgi:mxaK protein
LKERTKKLLDSGARLVAATLLVAALAAAARAGLRLRRGAADNASIAALAAGHDITPDHDTAVPVLVARARFLLSEGKIDEARAIAERLNSPDVAPERASLLYALGNEHLRQAMQIYLLVPLRQVKPLVNAAKAEYRQALQLDPDNWDCRYNFAIAATLIHETETSKSMIGAQMSHDRAAWPDIPGAPNGMP